MPDLSSLYSYELNFIWVGPKPMPSSQVENLQRMYDKYPKSVRFHFWVTEEIIDPELKAFFSSVGTVNDIEEILDPAIMPESCFFMHQLQQHELWASLSDVLRLLVITRPIEKDGLYKRFYLEADNDYLQVVNGSADGGNKDIERLAAITNGRGFAFHMLNECGDNDVRDQTDSFFIDLNDPVGQWFKKGLRTHLEMIFCDPIIKATFAEWLKYSSALSFTDVTYSTGLITSVLLRRVMHRRENFLRQHGVLGFCQDGKFAPASWNNAEVPKDFIQCAYTFGILFRLQQLKFDTKMATNEDAANSADDFSYLHRGHMPRSLEFPGNPHSSTYYYNAVTQNSGWLQAYGMDPKNPSHLKRAWIKLS